jgi:hypothetical protein
MPDDFSHQGERYSAVGTQWVKDTKTWRLMLAKAGYCYIGDFYFDTWLLLP